MPRNHSRHMTVVLHTHLPFRAWEDPVLSRLPGTQPLTGPWIIRDEAFTGQMAERDRLMAKRRSDVVVEDASAHPAALELLDHVLAELAQDPAYQVGADVLRPDGAPVRVDRTDPMGTLARLVQEDLCILEKHGDEHVLTAATLLFPSSWTLSEKFMRPLMAIHEPVALYDQNIGRRVQRMFDTLRVEQPIWRANWLTYQRPDLYHPRVGFEARPRPALGTGYLRSERQTIFRLPQTNAMVFSIHIYLLAVADLDDETRASLRRAEERRQQTP